MRNNISQQYCNKKHYTFCHSTVIEDIHFALFEVLAFSQHTWTVRYMGQLITEESAGCEESGKQASGVIVLSRLSSQFQLRAGVVVLRSDLSRVSLENMRGSLSHSRNAAYQQLNNALKNRFYQSYVRYGGSSL